jgi:hypothetical protein
MRWKDEDESDEFAAEVADGGEEDGEEDQLPCPSCGNMVYDDTDRCPHCGDWVMPLAAAASSRSNWIWWTALIVAALLFVTWGIFG